MGIKVSGIKHGEKVAISSNPLKKSLKKVLFSGFLQTFST